MPMDAGSGGGALSGSERVSARRCGLAALSRGHGSGPSNCVKTET
ncbi:MAG TPA: hypothetical protein VGJ93_11975 [Desulfuromonadaceae bacterium]